jgi:hypothetical protein
LILANQFTLPIPMAEFILLLAPLVIVPLGLNLIIAAQPKASSSTRPQNHPMLSLAMWAGVFVAAATLILSFAFPQGVLAATLALPWFVVTLVLAVWGATRFVKHVRAVDSQLCSSAALMFIAVGGGWTLLSRAGARPLGFSDDIVLLTGVHFHYAGFALPLLTAMTTAALPSRLNVPLILGIVSGVPLVGAGITMSELAGAPSSVEMTSALILVAACLLLVVQQHRVALRAKTPAVLTLLAVSSLSLLAGMILAAIYAVGRYLLAGWLDIPTMIPLHGLTNAIGFALCGLLAWHVSLSNQRRATS